MSFTMAGTATNIGGIGWPVTRVITENETRPGILGALEEELPFAGRARAATGRRRRRLGLRDTFLLGKNEHQAIPVK